MEVITFSPVYMQRIWGGREMASLYGRVLPADGAPYGESWEICDREDVQSVVNYGPLKGMSLDELWTQRREEIFGSGFENMGRFPLLIKILDARDDLSIQVHPPEEIASCLKAEPKTEMWYIAKVEKNAKLYIGLKEGVDSHAFEKAIQSGEVEHLVHDVLPQSDESIFIPSGRLHAIGGGFVIFEIQQNSDTTYRVFDWNRTGLDGRPRELHVRESMLCIDFSDIEPTMDKPVGDVLAECDFFKVEKLELTSGEKFQRAEPERFCIGMIVKGALFSELGKCKHSAGASFILPKKAKLPYATAPCTVLRISIPR